ncbi:MAG: sensor histidine kinase [Cyclobacteriaceae bacterium]
MRQTIDQIITSYWVLSMIPSAIVFFFFLSPELPNVLMVQPQYHGAGNQVVYYDLNGDGESELIYCKPGIPFNNLPIMSLDDKYYQQWNVPGIIDEGTGLMLLGDFDHDNKGEIYITALRRDSLFLSINEPFDSLAVVKEKYLVRAGMVNGRNNSMVKAIGLFDHNGDGNDELYFAVTSGFAVSPRVCMYYDQANDSIYSTPDLGINFGDPSFADIDQDGRPEIISNMTAPGNQTGLHLYSDASAWLMVLTDSLTMKFNPIEFEGFGGKLDVSPSFRLDQARIIASYRYEGVGEPKMQTGIYEYDAEGKQQGFRSWEEMGASPSLTALIDVRDHKQLVILGNPISFLGDEMVITRKRKLPFQKPYVTRFLDLDDDGHGEIFLTSGTQAIVLSSDGNQLAVSNVPFPVPPWYVSQERKGGVLLGTLFSSAEGGVLVRFRPNPKYELSFLAYPAIYLAFFILTWGTGRVASIHTRQRESLKQQLFELQLQHIKSQLDPHFTFNVLTTISYLVYTKDKRTAYDSLNLFTRLLRKVFQDAEQILRPIEEELSFVDDYIALEKMRFGDILLFETQQGDSITGKELVPRMSIQVFVENAVKHGIIPRQQPGIIRLALFHERDELCAIIEDNGIGREKAMQNGNGQGKGIKLNQRLFELLNRLYNTNIHFELEDLLDSQGGPSGTRVTLHIPTLRRWRTD